MILNTIPIDQPFIYQRDTWVGRHPIANGMHLLPFSAGPYDIIPSAVVTLTLHKLDNTCSYPVGTVDPVEDNNSWMIYWSLDDLMPGQVPLGYYYVRGSVEISTLLTQQILDSFKARIQSDGGILEAEDCMRDRLNELDDGALKSDLFKTEPFYIPHQAKVPATKGDFNQDFNTDFYV